MVTSGTSVQLLLVPETWILEHETRNLWCTGIEGVYPLIRRCAHTEAAAAHSAREAPVPASEIRPKAPMAWGGIVFGFVSLCAFGLLQIIRCKYIINMDTIGSDVTSSTLIIQGGKIRLESTTCQVRG